MNTQSAPTGSVPLAEQRRPQTLEAFAGQEHLTGPGKPLARVVETGRLHSMILWGPPGCGKTTLARILTRATSSEIIELSAVLSGVKDIRHAIDVARDHQGLGRTTVLFVDEVHRFNKSQQDAFLPHVESGLVTFIGATTENPSFELNNALLSRARTYVLKPLESDWIEQLLHSAAGSASVEEGAMKVIAAAADGDARRAYNFLEIALQLADDGNLTREAAIEASSQSLRRFDKGGDAFYDQISALHKSVRSSQPDAALYWFCRMIDGGCDPRYIARRILRMASEDIGNADPRALQISLDAWQTFDRLGSPEGELALAQAVIYLASCAKSNAAYCAFNAAMADVRKHGSYDVPQHLKNAPTSLMKSLGHGKGYQYDHDADSGIALDQRCFPVEMGEPIYYQPVDRGLETRIKEKLDTLRRARKGIAK